MEKRKYIRKFTEEEKNIFNAKIENEKVRQSTMSVYSYIIKQFIETDVEELEIGYRLFLKKYNRYHKAISLGTLSKRIATLVELGVIELDKVGQKHIYKLNRKVNSKLNSSKQVEEVENTTVEEVVLEPKSKILTKELYNTYIDVKDAVEIANRVIENELHIVDNLTKNLIIARVSEVAHTINPKGAINYIRTLAANTQQHMTLSAKRTNAINNAKKKIEWKEKKKSGGGFCDYTQREYDWEALENELNGW